MADDYDSRCKDLPGQNEEIQKEFSHIFKGFIRKILNLLADYIPFAKQHLRGLDFVEPGDSYPRSKEKIRQFIEILKFLRSRMI